MTPSEVTDDDIDRLAERICAKMAADAREQRRRQAAAALPYWRALLWLTTILGALGMILGLVGWWLGW